MTSLTWASLLLYVIPGQYINIFKNRWNNSDLLPGGNGPVQFCDENDDNCPDNKTLFRNLVLVLERMIFYSSHNEAYRDNFTKHEQYIMDNYAKYLPQLMYKVCIFVENSYEKLRLKVKI